MIVMQDVHFHLSCKFSVTFSCCACTECYQAVCYELMHYQVRL